MPDAALVFVVPSCCWKFEMMGWRGVVLASWFNSQGAGGRVSSQQRLKRWTGAGIEADISLDSAVTSGAPPAIQEHTHTNIYIYIYISSADTAPVAVEPFISAAMSVASYCLCFRCPLKEDLLIEDWRNMVSNDVVNDKSLFLRDWKGEVVAYWGSVIRFAWRDSVKTEILSRCKRRTGRDSM